MVKPTSSGTMPGPFDCLLHQMVKLLRHLAQGRGAHTRKFLDLKDGVPLTFCENVVGRGEQPTSEKAENTKEERGNDGENHPIVGRRNGILELYWRRTPAEHQE